MVGVGTSADVEASSDHETPKEPDGPYYCVAYLEGVPVSVLSKSDREASSTLDATFFGVALVAREARAGVAVHGGMYSGSCS